MSRRVLVVDDSLDAGDLLREYFALCGHEVRTAFSGPDALELVQAFDPDIAFIDIAMPAMDGLQVVRRLRALPRFATRPLIAVSAYTHEEDRREAIGAGFTDHLRKPLDLERLGALVAKAPERLSSG